MFNMYNLLIQDKAKLYKDLNTQTQLNVKTDKAKNIHIETCTHVNKGVVILPVKLQIIIRGKHITQSIKQKI